MHLIRKYIYTANKLRNILLCSISTIQQRYHYLKQNNAPSGDVTEYHAILFPFFNIALTHNNDSTEVSPVDISFLHVVLLNLFSYVLVIYSFQCT